MEKVEVKVEVTKKKERKKKQTSGIPNTDPLPATLKSQAAAISNPAPSANPLIRAIIGTGHVRIAVHAPWTFVMNFRAAAASGRVDSSVRSAPPMKDFGPAPVRVMARRLGVLEIWCRVEVRVVRRGVVREFSFLGRVIVRWAILVVLWRVQVVRIDILVFGGRIY